MEEPAGFSVKFASPYFSSEGVSDYPFGITHSGWELLGSTITRMLDEWDMQTVREKQAGMGRLLECLLQELELGYDLKELHFVVLDYDKKTGHVVFGVFDIFHPFCGMENMEWVINMLEEKFSGKD
ncbi:hypothetical protein COT30_03695 [Candidatus Micrarchaeota archaeon CG08_land_8_20_14_0_20_49_17]|nr:MAG: hypothetical protein COT30_03695 [Candidatus Micrarchaeota archaeon CG08_land_8_20_14_0_20_49_17]PIU81227.1 MAG: hypothetical protein COS70_05180 [Candidatus Micrarchaeota archaeon CG06_land_8_20_14_3_00_50_6]PIZ96585.1 MAG: hypothetical protein COX84_03825 [Candidatus Micrarchaeota archaeon CG_4_10_14_0_2_um_filter_49_7]